MFGISGLLQKDSDHDSVELGHSILTHAKQAKQSLDSSISSKSTLELQSSILALCNLVEDLNLAIRSLDDDLDSATREAEALNEASRDQKVELVQGKSNPVLIASDPGREALLTKDRIMELAKSGPVQHVEVNNAKTNSELYAEMPARVWCAKRQNRAGEIVDTKLFFGNHELFPPKTD
eukprot:Blabericola_migrator_1__8199@NODE_4240_length_1263_cov_283_052676_g2622_i0_p1_GENE_NODE_4240_length_1263_cov_283_052676_g2622_i0NODE_4240_length_1263_cov_283_052676_g2622_i0_p1_ORF_typecomplete_len179_score24_86MIPT3_C/PF17749_1/0_063_NODE_4240_length_1263_cov_283_052676_g2622_i052588